MTSSTQSSSAHPTNDITTCPSCGRRNRIASGGRPRCGGCGTDLAWIVDAGEHDFDDAIDTRSTVLVDLWAPWCGPCRIVAPAVEAAAREFAGRLKVVKVNVDDAPGISARFGVQGIPTLLLLQGGTLVDEQVGALPADRLAEWVRRTLERAPA